MHGIALGQGNPVGQAGRTRWEQSCGEELGGPGSEKLDMSQLCEFIYLLYFKSPGCLNRNWIHILLRLMKRSVLTSVDFGLELHQN